MAVGERDFHFSLPREKDSSFMTRGEHLTSWKIKHLPQAALGHVHCISVGSRGQTRSGLGGAAQHPLPGPGARVDAVGNSADALALP